MNTLAYRSNEDLGLSFELLVDGQLLGNLVGSRDTAIPYWIIREDLPYWPPSGNPGDLESRIVCVCSCGEYGCGHTRCRVIRDEEKVIFWEFDGDVSREGGDKSFEFTRANYDKVVSEIVRHARQKC